MKPHVLLIEPMMSEVEAQLDAAYCVHRLFTAHDRAALIAAIGSSVRAIVTGGAHGANNEIVDALPRLEIVAINGIGADAVDLERARARSVRVTTTPDVLTEDVADLATSVGSSGLKWRAKRASSHWQRRFSPGPSLRPPFRPIGQIEILEPRLAVRRVDRMRPADRQVKVLG
jgi:phosphoglycerate dehydrogenase-like enzyme